MIGLLLLWAGVEDASQAQDLWGVAVVVTGMLALLAGTTAVLPWLLERLTGLSRGGGPLSLQLAVRRLQLSSESATRSVNGIVVAVAGAIALQTFFTGISPSSGSTHRAPAHTGGTSAAATQVGVAHLDDGNGYGNTARYASAFAATPGVTQAVGYGELTVTPISGGLPQTVRIADCSELGLLAALPTCTNGDTFLAVPHGSAGTDDMTDWNPGTRTRVGAESDGPQWRIPHITRTVHAGSGDPQDAFPERTLLLTPKAADATALAHATSSVSLTYRAAQPDVQDRIRTTAAKLDPRFNAVFPARPTGDLALNAIKRALLAGVAATLLLIAASMLIGSLEQIRDHQRILAMLVAFGTRRRTLGASLLWQTALPVTIGLLVAALVGTTLGNALLGLIGATAPVDWNSMLAMTGIAAAAVLLVTALTLPALRRTTRPDALRHE